MEVRYKTDLYASYAFVTIPQTVNKNTYVFKMLQNNKIGGVCSCRERIEDGEGYFYIDITGKKNLWQEYQEREMELSDLIILFQNLINISDELKKYLISERMIWLDPEFIYIDIENGSVSVVVIPWENDTKYPLRNLAEFLLEKMNHTDEYGVNAAYHFYRQQSQPQFVLSQFMPILEKESILHRKKENEKESDKNKNEKVQENSLEEYALYEKEEIQKEIRTERRKKAEEAGKNFSFEEEPARRGIRKASYQNKNHVLPITFLLSFLSLLLIFIPSIEKNQKLSCIALSITIFITGILVHIFRWIKRKRGAAGIFKENIREMGFWKNNMADTYEMVDPGETVFFSSKEEKESLRLRWKEKGKKKEVELTHLPFTVGKKKEVVSLILQDPSVSRIHCRFVEKEGGVGIMDLGSTNGTSLNGIKLKKEEVLEIVKNDEILIGNIRLLVV